MHCFEFGKNYMVFRPEKASFFKLVLFLWSGDIALGNEAFIHFPEGHESRQFIKRRKWLIFFTLLAQKFLSWVAKPLRNFGRKFEHFLNLIAKNGNLFRLIVNFLQGKVKEADDINSPTFMSVIGFTDKRVNLDCNIEREDSKYNRALAAMAAKIAYENEAFIKNTVTTHWEMELIKYYNNFHNVFDGEDKGYNTQAFMCHDKKSNPNLIVVAFRGTEFFNADDWSTDIDISWYELGRKMGKVHGGFSKALGLQKKDGFPKEIKDANNGQLPYYTIREKLKELVLKNNKTKFIVTGHSLGGALAILFASILMLHKQKFLLERLEGVYTLGQPRVGDKGFQEFMEKKLKKNDVKYERIVYSNDLVPRVPFDDSHFLFKHFGKCHYYNSSYKLEIRNEQPNKNYFNPLEVISMFLNAVLEIIRGFIIPFKKGPDYKESWLLFFIRIFGFIMPGFTGHNLHDYVNATRLGSK